MARKPTRIDDDAPPLTDAELAEMRPAAEVLTAEELAAVTSVLRAVRGRPPVADAKVPVTIGLDADTVAAFKATGAGWQTRMNDVLRAGKPTSPGQRRPVRPTSSRTMSTRAII